MADVRVTSGQNGRLLHCFLRFWFLNGGREGQLAHTLTNCSLLTYGSSVCVCACFSRSPQGEALGMPCSVSARHCWTAPRSSCRHKEGTQGKHSQPLPPTPTHSIPPAAHTKQQTHAHGMLQLYTCTHHTMTGGGGHINICSDGFCIYKNLGTQLGRNL